MVNSKEVFETYAFSYFQRLNFARPSPKNLRLSMEWYKRSMESVTNTIQDPVNALNKDNLLAVWTLSLHAPLFESDPESEESTGPCPTQGPLNSLHLVNLVDRIMKFAPVHRQGFLKLLELRGGLQSLDLGEAAYAVSLAEVFHATQTLCCPQIEFASSLPLDLRSSLASNTRPDHPLHCMGLGFAAMQKLSCSRYCEQVRTALDSLALYSLGVDDFFAGRPSRKPLGLLAQERGFVQHAYTSLYPDQTTPDAAEKSDKDTLLHVIYSAGMIYTLLCVMPIPHAPFATLVRQLQKSFREHDFSESWEKAPQLMTWVMVMFAIAAIGMPPERAWAVAVLDRCSRHLMIHSWDGMQALVSEFLWLPITNDLDGMELWDEIEGSNPFDAGEGVGRINRD